MPCVDRRYPGLCIVAKQPSENNGYSDEHSGAADLVVVDGSTIAKARGATVTAVCSARNAALVAELGADEVLDYGSAEWTSAMATYDVVLDAAAVYSLGEGLKRTRRGGTFVSLNPGFGNPLFKLAARLRSRRVDSLMVQAVGVQLRRLAAWLAAGTLRPTIDRVYALGDVADAQRYSESKRARGKIVLEIA